MHHTLSALTAQVVEPLDLSLSRFLSGMMRL